MLNHEGWCLLLILCALIALLLIALPHMRVERTIAARLAACGSPVWTAAGIVLRTCGVLVLAVIPSAVSRGGVMRLGLPVFCAAGLAVLLCIFVPRMKKRAPQALTLSQAVMSDQWARMEFGVLCAAALLISAAAAVSMLARMFAYVFSLHYMIALGAAVGFALMLTLLCGVQSRRNMDKLQIVLLNVLIIGTPVAALIVSGNAPDVLRALASFGGQEKFDVLYILCDLCAGFGALGLLLPAQKLFNEHKQSDVRKSGIVASVCIAVLMLLAALAGAAARAAGIKLESIPAAETALTQIAELSALPQPISALLTAALLTTLLLYAQSALHFVGTTLSWDVVQPLICQRAERPAAQMAELFSAAACLLTFPLSMNAANTPLEWYARDVLLIGMVTGSTLLLRVCGAKVGRIGSCIGLAAGAAAVVIVWLLPVPEKWKLLGGVPAALFTVLPQLLIQDKESA